MEPIQLVVKKSCLDTTNISGSVDSISLNVCRNVVVKNNIFTTRFGYNQDALLPNETFVNEIVQFESNSNGEKIVVITDKLYVYDPVSGEYKTNGRKLFNNPKARVSSFIFKGTLFFFNGDPESTDGSLNGIFTYDGNSLGTVNLFSPKILDSKPSSTYVVGAKQMGILGNVVMLFGTYEKDSNGVVTYHRSRVRWAGRGGVDYWITEPGGGGFLDCPTYDEIISVNRVGGRFLVFFKREVWSLIPSTDPYKLCTWILLRSETRACLGTGSSCSSKNVSVFSVGLDGIFQTTIVEKNQRLVPQKADQRVHDLVQEKFLSMSQTDSSPLVYVDNEEEIAVFCFQKESLVFSTSGESITTFDKTFNSFCDLTWTTNKRMSDLKNPFYEYVGNTFYEYRAIRVFRKLFGGFNGEIYSLTKSPYDTYLSGDRKIVKAVMQTNDFGSNLVYSRLLSLDLICRLGKGGRLSWSLFKDGNRKSYQKRTGAPFQRTIIDYLGVVTDAVLDVQSGKILLQVLLKSQNPSYITSAFLYAVSPSGKPLIEGLFSLYPVVDKGFSAFNFFIPPGDSKRIDLLKATLPWDFLSKDPFSNSYRIRLGSGDVGITHGFEFIFSGESVVIADIGSRMAKVAL